MAIQRQIWVNYIIEALFAQNPFLAYAMNWDEFIREGVSVHIPQSGDASDIVMNATSFPLPPSDRADAELIFNLDTFYVKPVRIAKIDEYELSYNKRESVLGLNLKALADKLALTVLYRWAAAHGTTTDGSNISAAKVIRTTGDATTATFQRTIGKTTLRATGNRKRLRKEDLVAAQLAMDEMDVPLGDRYALIPAGMMTSLMLDSDLMKRDNALEMDPKTGSISKLYGFTLMKRSRGVAYSNAGTPVAIDPATVDAANAAAVANYNNSALFWHKNSVGRAQGPTEPFEDENNPQFYGSLLSFLQKFGAAKSRLDAIGVLSIVEDTVV